MSARCVCVVKVSALFQKLSECQCELWMQEWTSMNHFVCKMEMEKSVVNVVRMSMQVMDARMDVFVLLRTRWKCLL